MSTHAPALSVAAAPTRVAALGPVSTWNASTWFTTSVVTIILSTMAIAVIWLVALVYGSVFRYAWNVGAVPVLGVATIDTYWTAVVFLGVTKTLIFMVGASATAGYKSVCAC